MNIFLKFMMALPVAAIFLGCTMQSEVSELIASSESGIKIQRKIFVDVTTLTISEGSAAVINVVMDPKMDVPADVQLLLIGPAGRFQLVPLFVTIPAGSTSKSVVLQTVEDNIYQGTASFQFSISSADPAVVASPGVIQITLVDNDPMPTLSIDSPSVNESAGTMSFTVTQSIVSAFDTEFVWSTQDNSAFASVDFTGSSSQTATIPAGQTSVQLTVPISDDAIIEAHKSFWVNLSAPVYATILGAQGTGTILDDDGGVGVEFSVASQSVSEAAGTVTVTANLSTISAYDVTVPIIFSGTAADPSDYSMSGASIFIPQGQTSVSLTMTIVSDNSYEPNETVIMTMGAPSYGYLGTISSETVNINNDDVIPTLSVADVSVSEGVGIMNFTVSLSVASGYPVSFDWTTLDGTALQAAGDYTTSSGAGVIIPAGSSSVTVAIPIMQDFVYEGDETLQVAISNPVTATLGTSSATVTITDDDAMPTISIAGVTVNETDATATLTVSLSNASGLVTTFNWTTSDGTAAAPGDYTTSSAVGASIAAGTLNMNIVIPILDDSTDENDETVAVTLSNLSGASAGTLSNTITITDDDLPPTMNIWNVTDDEFSRDLGFSVTLSAASGKVISVDYATSDGTAVAGIDYTASTNTLTIPAGQPAGTIYVPVEHRPKNQGNRDFNITLSNAINATLLGASALGTIIESSPASPQMIKEIGLAPATLTAALAIGGKVFFTNTDAAHGEELWVSDGTSGGTVLLKDIYPGATGSSISNMVDLGGVLFFAANDGVNGSELWRSDGTPGGTTLLKDIYPGVDGSSPASLLVWSGKLYFRATDATNGTELWISDGTALGTTLVADIYPGAGGSDPYSFTGLGSKVIFYSYGMGTGSEPWVTDGTTLGTQLLKDIREYSSSSNPSSFTSSGSYMYFSARSYNEGYEPWVTDGTPAGTVLLKDIGYNPGYGASLSSNATSFTNVSGKMFFIAQPDSYTNTNYALYASDGTTAGTISVFNFKGSGSLKSFGSNLIFTGPDLAGTYGNEIWVSDGTVLGTTLLKDIAAGGSDSSPALLGQVGSYMLFTANDGTNGNELWRTDGTAVGTVLVKDINSGSAGSAVFSFTTDGTLGWFVANDGINGAELWKTDGTNAGTVMVADINPGSAPSAPRQLTALGSNLFFLAYDSATMKSEVGFSDGTAMGTELFMAAEVKSSGAYITSMVDFNNQLFFAADDGTRGSQLWKSDGTLAGTQIVKDILPSAGCVQVSNLKVFGSSLFFTSPQQDIGTEPMLSDGTAGGTSLLKDINATGYGASSSASNPTVLGSKLFFNAYDGVIGSEPWITDGTLAGTINLADIVPGVGSGSLNPITTAGSYLFLWSYLSGSYKMFATDGTPAGTQQLMSSNYSPNGIALGSNFIFSAGEGTYGLELWKSDGTPAGTSVLVDINPGSANSSPSGFVKLGSVVLFSANHPSYGNELWKTDGTPAGTQLVKDILPGTGGSISTLNTVAVGGLVYFFANDGVNGIELWKTDGTAAGTVMLKEITPGSGSTSFSGTRLAVGSRMIFDANDGTGYTLWSTDGTAAGTFKILPTGVTSYSNSTVQNGILYFSAITTNYGTELYRSDGTIRGTYLIDDLEAGSASSTPNSFLFVNGKVYFRATNLMVGEELWSLTP